VKHRGALVKLVCVGLAVLTGKSEHEIHCGTWI